MACRRKICSRDGDWCSSQSPQLWWLVLATQYILVHVIFSDFIKLHQVDYGCQMWLQVTKILSRCHIPLLLFHIEWINYCNPLSSCIRLTRFGNPWQLWVATAQLLAYRRWELFPVFSMKAFLFCLKIIFKLFFRFFISLLEKLRRRLYCILCFWIQFVLCCRIHYVKLSGALIAKLVKILDIISYHWMRW